jgi:hypothetical protein
MITSDWEEIALHLFYIFGWFSLGTQGSFTNKTDRHDIAEKLLKVALNTITPYIFGQYNHCCTNSSNNLYRFKFVIWISEKLTPETPEKRVVHTKFDIYVFITMSCCEHLIYHNSIQYYKYVIKFDNDLWQVGGFLRVVWFFPNHW